MHVVDPLHVGQPIARMTASVPYMLPVHVDGAVQLWDIFAGGCWLGSRRTLEQCGEVIRQWYKWKKESPCSSSD